MAVKIKLKRLGKIREPYYRIVVADARTKRDGRAIEEIGKYHPKEEPSFIEVNSERAQHWLSVGAQPTDPVRALLKITGDWQKFTGEAGAEGTLRTAKPRTDKKERFEAAAKESQASKEAKEDKGTKAATQSRAARSAKEPAAKESPAKEPVAKESPAEDTVAKESPAEDTVAKESPAEDTVAKESPAEDTVAKDSTAQGGAAKDSGVKDADVGEADGQTASQDAGAADVKAAAGESGSGA